MALNEFAGIVKKSPNRYSMLLGMPKPERVGVWPVTVKLVVAVALEKLPEAA